MKASNVVFIPSSSPVRRNMWNPSPLWSWESCKPQQGLWNRKPILLHLLLYLCCYVVVLSSVPSSLVFLTRHYTDNKDTGSLLTALMQLYFLSFFSFLLRLITYLLVSVLFQSAAISAFCVYLNLLLYGYCLFPHTRTHTHCHIQSLLPI